MSLTTEETERLVVLEQETKHISEDVNELRVDMKDCRTKLDNIEKTLLEIQYNQNNGFGNFFNKNGKIILGIIILLVSGTQGPTAISFIKNFF